MASNYRGGVQNRARFGIKIPNVCAGFLAILHSAELGAEWPAQEGKHGGQPAGLPDRSRWSYPLPRTTTGKPRRMAEGRILTLPPADDSVSLSSFGGDWSLDILEDQT